MKVRRHIYFSGRVQGVGFRHTCKTVAASYDVSGWVKNLNNGSVEMIVEGESKTIDRYVKDICDSTHGRVEHIQSTESGARSEFESMQIRC